MNYVSENWITAKPVKYMVVKGWLFFKIIDTSYAGDGDTVCRFMNLRMAHLMCKLLNEAEGYEYPIHL